MTVSVPRRDMLPAGTNLSKWNDLITQFKYTSTLSSKSSSKSKKVARTWAEGCRMERLHLRGPATQGQLSTMGGAFRTWRRTAESNGTPCGAPGFQAGRDPPPRSLQTVWRRAEESNNRRCSPAGQRSWDGAWDKGAKNGCPGRVSSNPGGLHRRLRFSPEGSDDELHHADTSPCTTTSVTYVSYWVGGGWGRSPPVRAIPILSYSSDAFPPID